MPRDLVPSRTEPKDEISTPIVKHDKVWGVTKVREKNMRAARKEARTTKRGRKAAHHNDFLLAQARLSTMHPASAVEFLQAMPVGVLELYLLAEEKGQARPAILRAFPAPGLRARERYLPTPRRPSTRNPAPPIDIPVAAEA
jgi:hypothetical protein